MIELKNKKIGVIGIGRSGVAAAGLCARHGAGVFASDIRASEKLGKYTRELKLKGIEFETGGHNIQKLLESDIVIVSPGVPLNQEMFIELGRKSIPVIGELELAWLFSKAPFIAVTGTKGKTTTVSIIGEILKSAGRKVLVAGNIGRALCNEIEQVPKDGIVVSETSSFQLESIDRFKPAISIILNITADHMDRYENIQQYAEAKARIFRNQDRNDILVLNAQDKYSPIFAKMAANNPIRILYFTLNSRNFDEGVWMEGGKLFAHYGGRNVSVGSAADLLIRGEHNIANAMAASIAGLVSGASPEIIIKALAAFPGVPHRQELVAEIHGVKYINNSQGTNIDAVSKSLLSFDPPIVLIAGGRNKGAKFEDLSDLVRGRVKKLILIGESKDEMRRALKNTAEIEEAATLEEAVAIAAAASSPGTTVLLSPACASFDMFSNYEERGNVFRAAVMALEGGQAK